MQKIPLMEELAGDYGTSCIRAACGKIASAALQYAFTPDTPHLLQKIPKNLTGASCTHTLMQPAREADGIRVHLEVRESMQPEFCHQGVGICVVTSHVWYGDSDHCHQNMQDACMMVILLGSAETR